MYLPESFVDGNPCCCESCRFTYKKVQALSMIFANISFISYIAINVVKRAQKIVSVQLIVFRRSVLDLSVLKIIPALKGRIRKRYIRRYRVHRANIQVSFQSKSKRLSFRYFKQNPYVLRLAAGRLAVSDYQVPFVDPIVTPLVYISFGKPGNVQPGDDGYIAVIKNTVGYCYSSFRARLFITVVDHGRCDADKLGNGVFRAVDFYDHLIALADWL